MNDDLPLLADWVRGDNWPSPLCPVCRVGHLVVDHISNVLSARSANSRDDEDWDPEWEFGFFHGTLRCQRRGCREVVIVAGEMKTDLLPDDGRYATYGPFHRLQFAVPALPIVDLPPECPSRIRELMDGCSQVLWSDPPAAANRLRFAVEELFTLQRINRYTVRNHRRTRLSAHARILLLKKAKPEGVGETLEAVKWIGNQGSHDDKLTIIDVLDGADLLSHALRLLYDSEPKRMLRVAQVINKRKGITCDAATRSRRGVRSP
jgi:hypothetical protein